MLAIVVVLHVVLDHVTWNHTVAAFVKAARIYTTTRDTTLSLEDRLQEDPEVADVAGDGEGRELLGTRRRWNSGAAVGKPLDASLKAVENPGFVFESGVVAGEKGFEPLIS